MEKPKIPADEDQRLEALKKYNILYTEAEKNFDDITKLAAEICQTKSSVISLIDDKNQWCKSRVGTNLTLIPRDLSICAHSLTKHDEILHIPDLRLDNRFSNNPIVISEPKIVFYIGVPLVTREGYVLGTLCAFDSKPKTLEPHQLTALKILANQVMQLLELRKNNLEMIKIQSELKKRNDELEHFSYMVSHDLQEPLRNIAGIIGIIEKRYLDNMDETGKSYFKHVTDAAERMKQLIFDILDYSKITKSSLVKESVDMNLIVKEVLGLFAEKIKESKALIKVAALPVVKAEKIAMFQIIQNLISNALKYNRSATPELIVDCEEESDFWKFSVADNGIGIDPAYAEKIFVIFKRLHNKSEFSGTGVGLAICKKVAERYDGKIWVEHLPEGGSKFVFTIRK